MPIEYADESDELDDPFDPYQQPFEEAQEDASDLFLAFGNEVISEGVLLAHQLAEQQPLAAKDVLYGGQFTDQNKRLPRAVLTDVHVYAEHFKINPNEDMYMQVERLRRGYEWVGLELYLEAVERVVA